MKIRQAETTNEVGFIYLLIRISVIMTVA